MLVPSRVLIISNAVESENEYYDKFVGTEHVVVDSHEAEITLAVPDSTGSKAHTIWYNGEYEVLDWDDNETVTISKTEYDELLEFKKLCDERLVYERMYEDKDLEDI